MLGLLGFAKTRDHVWFDGELAIDIKQADADTPDYQRYAPGLNHIGFTAPDAAALEAVRDGMAERGFDVPGRQGTSVMPVTFFKDPDGMRVEVTVYG